MSKRIVFGMTGAYGSHGGIASHNKNIIRALNDLSVDRQNKLYILGVHEEQGALPPDLGDGVEFRGFGSKKMTYALRLVREVVHRPLFVFDHVRLSLSVIPFARAGMCRLVIFAHGSESWRRLRPLSRLAYRAANSCLTNSEYTLRKMRARMDRFVGGTCLLGLPPDFEVVESDDGPVSLRAVDGRERMVEGRMLLLVGRMDSRERGKGHEGLLSVATALRVSFPSLQLVFAGPGDDRERLAGVALGEGLGDCVFIPGPVDRKMLGKLYRKCYAFVMPSRQEGFGIVYLEAMAHGKACVASRFDGGADVVIDLRTGRLINDPLDLRELTVVLTQLLGDPERTGAMGQAGRKRVEADFSAQHAQDRIRSQLEALLV